MTDNLILLTFTAFYSPAYKAGGPVQSIANLVEHLGGEIGFWVVTGDRDSGDPQPFAGIPRGEWTDMGRGRALYLGRVSQSLWRIARILRETPHDAVYLNSFFNPRSTTLPLLAQRLRLAPRRPVIVAPRGEFSPGALDLKRRKKMAYIAFAKALGLYRTVLWQASSMHEERDIRAIFGARARIRIASDLPRAVHGGAGHVPREPGQPLRVIFLSRISPKKNLTFALEVLARVTVPVDFSVVGPIGTPAYWTECNRLIEALPPHIHVHHHGSVPAPEVPKVLAQHDLFFLPTLGENFGHVIIEALGAGTPALISDRTPWQDFEAEGCGWVEPLSTPDAHAAHIETLFTETPQEASVRRQAAVRYAHRYTEESTIIDDNRRLFQSVSPQRIK